MIIKSKNRYELENLPAATSSSLPKSWTRDLISPSPPKPRLISPRDILEHQVRVTNLSVPLKSTLPVKIPVESRQHNLNVGTTEITNFLTLYKYIFWLISFPIVTDPPPLSNTNDIYYKQPELMGGVSKTELNLAHFYTNPNFLLTPWKDIANLNMIKCWINK